MNRSHPIFSRFGCGATLLLVVVLAAILILFGGGPFSPGPLTAGQPTGQELGGFRAHAEFEADCQLCHAPWAGPTAERCQACHVEVAEQRASGSGLHGLMPDTDRCQRCHTDHDGRDAHITEISDLAFDHQRLVGFSLNQHAARYDGSQIICDDCHGPKGYDANRVDCVTCHTAADAQFMTEHTELFGKDCLSCHDGLDTMAQFEHNLVFPLNGAHFDAACSDCHANRTFQEVARVCVDCHTEPAIHAGQFGTDCARCHTTTAWTPAELTGHTFPLDHGGEGKIDCVTCHETTYTEFTCYNCHAHDQADVREEHLEEGITDFSDCAECHPTGREHEGEFADD